MTTLAATIATPKKPNRFISFLEHVGHDFKAALPKITEVAATAGETAVSIFAPGASALFDKTVAAVITAEQSAAAIGAQAGSGTQKLAAVVNLMGPLIAQALSDVGKANDQASVEKYVSAVVTILNAVPAPAPVVAPTSTSSAPTGTVAPVATASGAESAPPSPSVAAVSAPSAAETILGG